MIDAARLRLLEAMGIEVYALRAREATATASAPDDRTTDGAHAPPRLAVVGAHGVRNEARLARLFKHLPHTFGIAAGAIEWIEADTGGALARVAEAQAYLVLGAAMARALGAQLPTERQSRAAIAVTADPDRLPGTGADKRALWQALKPLVRRLHAPAP